MDKSLKMEEFLLYGDASLRIVVPDGCQADRITPEYIPPAADPLPLVQQAISTPIGDLSPAFNRLTDKSIVAIAINDKTRPVPNEILLPPLLDFIQSRLRIPKAQIRFFIASGTHTPMLPEEYHHSLPRSLAGDYEVVVHDCDDENSLISIGKTSRNTTIRINREYYSSDLKIVVGNIEPHHFAGFSGGVKTAAIGLTARETIRENHSHLMDDRATIASYDQNPLRQDIEEIGERIGVDLALNAVLNSEQQIVRVLFGNPTLVMQKGMELSKTICQTRVHKRYEIVIASGGGYPKDINFYQAQKAISHACTLVKDGGTVILAAECREGVGSPGMEKFMKGINHLEEIPNRFQKEGFNVGPHKAFLLYRQLKNVKIYLVSRLDPSITQRYFLSPFTDIQEALQNAINSCPNPPAVAILPHAINTIPCFE